MSQNSVGPSSVHFIPDVRYGTAGDFPLFLDILRPAVLPPQALAVVIHIHGGDGMWAIKDG